MKIPLSFLLLISTSTAWAEPKLESFSPGEQSATFGLAATALILPAYLEGPKEPNWKGGILLDDPIHRALGSKTPEGTHLARYWSDWGRTLLVATPILFPGPTGGDGRLQGVQSFAVAGLVSFGLKVAIGRERPYGAQCQDNPLGQDCFSGYRNESFPSGHATMAFTGAGLLCALREDALCPIGLGVASLTGALRILGNQHFFSDVLAGALLGWASGYWLPRWTGNLRSSAASSPSSDASALQQMPVFQIRLPLGGV